MTINLTMHATAHLLGILLFFSLVLFQITSQCWFIHTHLILRYCKPGGSWLPSMYYFLPGTPSDSLTFPLYQLQFTALSEFLICLIQGLIYWQGKSAGPGVGRCQGKQAGRQAKHCIPIEKGINVNVGFLCLSIYLPQDGEWKLPPRACEDP